MNTITDYIKFDEIRLKMTVAEYESTDFYEMTDKAIIDYIKSAGEAYTLTRKYHIELLDEEGNVTGVQKLTVAIDSTTFLFTHRDIVKDKNTGGYRFNW